MAACHSTPATPPSSSSRAVSTTPTPIPTPVPIPAHKQDQALHVPAKVSSPWPRLKSLPGDLFARIYRLDLLDHLCLRRPCSRGPSWPPSCPSLLNPPAAITSSHALLSFFFFLLLSTAVPRTEAAATAASPLPLPVPNSGLGHRDPTLVPSFMRATVPPPVDFSSLGQMAVLGEFDGLTPIVTQGQQNTFESNTFSILELLRVSSTNDSTVAAGGDGTTERFLTVPVLLASFSMDTPSGVAPATSQKSIGITTTCVLENAPHQVYIGGHFNQLTPSTSAPPSSASANTTTSSTSAGLNYIGLYDSKQRRFLAMGNGLDGAVQDLICDSATNQVYAVGQFRAPLRDPTKPSATSAGDNKNSVYQFLGSYGGGVAVWKQQDTTSSSFSQASGHWSALPFKGVNGIVQSVVKASDGTFYFGGQFDTTTDGESFSAPDTQPVHMADVQISSGNGIDSSQDNSIICEPSSSSSPSSKENWLLRDSMPGYWRVQFPLYITPTLFRIWNIDTTLPGSENRGTQSFSVMAQPTNQRLNLSYIDPITLKKEYCTICPLAPRTESVLPYQGHQDFVVVNPVLLHAVQVDIISWQGLGGGLGGFEVFQSEIFVRAVQALNYVPPCDSSNGTVSSDTIAFSTPQGVDWKTIKMQYGWQTVLAAEISTRDFGARQQAMVDMVPFLQESGMYDVYLYTPACTPGQDKKNSSEPSNSCSRRGSVDVKMYFGSPDNVMSMTISQTNTVDKYDKIYSGMVLQTSTDFKPHVVVGPSVTDTSASGGGDVQTVIVDSIQFVKQATLNNTNSLLFYRPGGSNAGKGAQGSLQRGTITASKVEGLDSSTWGNLPTQLPSGALVTTMVAYTGPVGSSSSSLIIIGGEFQGKDYINIVAWDGSSFEPLDQGRHSSSLAGLGGRVTGMFLVDTTLYVVGRFVQSYGSGPSGSVSLPGGLATYSVPTGAWSSFGNATTNFMPGAQFESIHLSKGSDGRSLLMLGGNFTWKGEATAQSVAIWDLSTQTWVRDPPNDINKDFAYGFIHGQISYLNRVPGSNDSRNASTPVVIVAGRINSFDMYQVADPQNMAWLNNAGKLKTMNLMPQMTIESNSSPATLKIPDPPVLPKTNAGLIYFSPNSQQWLTVVGGAHADGTIGAGVFHAPAVPLAAQEANNELHYRELSFPMPPVTGEILALGIDKDDASGVGSKEAGNDLLLIGGRFRSSDGANSASGGAVNAIMIYDLKSDQVVPATLMPTMRADTGQEPVIHVIKSYPGKGVLVVGGQFSGMGSDLICDSICLWTPAHAREAIEKQRSVGASFRSLYGDGVEASIKKHLGVLKGVVYDLAFEDDKNMYVAGDLVVNGVACGVASFNFDHGKWITFGSILGNSTKGAAVTNSLGPDTLPGPATAIAHDSQFHQFFVAGRSSVDGSAFFKKWNGNQFISVSSEFMPTSEIHRLEILPASVNAPVRTPASSPSSPTDINLSSDPSSLTNIDGKSPSSIYASSPAQDDGAEDSNDTTYLLEQGFILLVAGKVVLGDPRDPALTLSNSHQESSLAFFDGQSWYPYLQSSRNGSNTASSALSMLTTPVSTSTIFSGSKSAVALDGRPLAASALAKIPTRVRDQGVFRGLAIAHLPRIIAREYLALPYVILISIVISLGLIGLIVLFGFFYVWLKKRLAKEPEVKRPRLGTSFMEDGSPEMAILWGKRRGSSSYFNDTVGSNHGAFFAGTPGAATPGGPLDEKKYGTLASRSKSGRDKGPENASALLASLGITSALDSRLLRNNSIRNHRPQARVSGSSERIGSESGSRRRSGAGVGGVDGPVRDSNGSQMNLGPGPVVYRPNSTIEEANVAIATEFVRSRSREQQQRAAAVAAANAAVVAQHPNRVSGASSQGSRRVSRSGSGSGSDKEKTPEAPPSPDRRSKKSRHSSIPAQATIHQPGRDSSSSDLTNPASQARFASLLAAANTTGASPSASVSNAPTSPATTVASPGPGGLNSGSGSSHQPTGSETNSGMIYYAKYSFRAREIGELGFKAGERILVVDMSDDIWWMGVVQDSVTGQQLHGVFPSNYVGRNPPM